MGPSSSDIGSAEYFRSFRVKPSPAVFNTLRSILSEVKSESLVCRVRAPHTAHPASSKVEGLVALQKLFIIFLRNEASGGLGGNVLCLGASTSKLSGCFESEILLTCVFCVSQYFKYHS